MREAIAELAQKADINRISWRGRERGERDDIEVMIERNPLRAKFGALDVALPPLAFLQPTQAGEAALVEAVMELLPASGKFADLFAGSGTFTGPMLARGSVDAYESVAPAIRALDKAKGALPLKAFRRDLEREPLRREEANRYDAIVFDPPRAGAAEQVEGTRRGQDAAADRRFLQSGDVRARRAHPRRWRLSPRQRQGDRPVHLVASCRAGGGIHPERLRPVTSHRLLFIRAR